MNLYNGGDEVGALAVLDRLIDAREHARQVGVNIETAAERRRVATLARNAKDKGKVRADAVIARYEEVTRLDPGVHWDWVELGRMYQEAGRLPEARQAATRAAETADGQRDRSVALNELGDVLVAQGDLAGARQRFQDSLDIAKRLADADPSSAVLQRDVAASLWRMASLPASGVTWQDVAAAFESMRSRGTLRPTDQAFAEEARRRSAAQAAH